jgi:hypothetical protein
MRPATLFGFEHRRQDRLSPVGRIKRRPGALNSGVQPELFWPSRPAWKTRRSAEACDVQEQHHSGVQPELWGVQPRAEHYNNMSEARAQ